MNKQRNRKEPCKNEKIKKNGKQKKTIKNKRK